MANKPKSAYKHIEKHVFRPEFSSEYREEIEVCVPLMACEIQPYPLGKHYNASEFQEDELKSARRQFSQLFAECCSKMFKKHMTPKIMMKAMVSSAELKAAEVSLWGAYTVSHLFIDSQAKRMERSTLNYCLENLPVSSKEILATQENESPQDFNLIQIRLRWVENNKRRGALSKVKPIVPGGWFESHNEECAKFASNIKSIMPGFMPKIKDSIYMNITEAAEKRIEKHLSEWNSIIIDRYKSARALCIANELGVAQTLRLFARDKIISKLDKLITLERGLATTPSVDNMLADDHARLATDLLLQDTSVTAEWAYITRKGEVEDVFDNIHLVPIVYDLADNL